MKKVFNHIALKSTVSSPVKTGVYYFILMAILSLSSCTDVIELDVPSEAPRLVIEASINWEKETVGNNQRIKLSKSTPYFDTNGTEPVLGASVKITNDTNGADFIFTDNSDGTYSTDSFVPILNNSYTLEVINEGETYIAQENLIAVPSILSVYQSTDYFFQDLLEVNFEFIDPIDEVNYYFIKFQEATDLLPTLSTLKDEFINGNLITISNERRENEDINQEPYAPGDLVDMELYGISKEYYDYMTILINQSESGGPFDTTPVPLRGNCINVNTPDSDPYGYFRITEVSKATYVFE
jgi:hypothetical protein